MSKCHGITANNKSHSTRPVEPKRKQSDVTFGRNCLSECSPEPVDV